MHGRHVVNGRAQKEREAKETHQRKSGGGLFDLYAFTIQVSNVYAKESDSYLGISMSYVRTSEKGSKPIPVIKPARELVLLTTSIYTPHYHTPHPAIKS